MKAQNNVTVQDQDGNSTKPHDMDNFQEVEKHVISRVKKNICDVCGCEKDKEKECDYCIRQYALSWGL